MHTPVVALISADSSSRTVLEEAVSERSTTLLTATTTEAGLRLLSQRRDLTLIVCDDSEGRIARASTALLPAGKTRDCEDNAGNQGWSTSESRTPCRKEEHGRHDWTRTSDLFRVKEAL